jgi:mono/diheme cytochrome c family protein
VRRALPFIVLLVLLAGCGGEEQAQPLPETVVGTVAEPAGGEGDPEAGEQVFAESGCGSCHTFEPAGSSGMVGPDLDELPQLAEQANQGTLEEFTRTSITQADAYVEEGFQPGVMPPFTGSQQELADLVAFLTQQQ